MADPARCPAQDGWTEAISAANRGTKAALSEEASGKNLPPEAQKIVAEFDRDSQEIHRKSEEKIDGLRDDTVRRLKPLQDKYTREAKLDEALVIREQIRRINRVQPDPGTLGAQKSDIGRTWYFEVVGGTEGSVWGSEIYTTDSYLAAASVHAGVLKPGEKGIVKVTILPGQPAYQASIKNGVSTHPYGSWNISFRVEKYFP